MGGNTMPEYDLVIRGGTMVDGSGIPRYRADLAVMHGRVAMISGTIRAGGVKELDAGGCIVAPGAIDLHTHYDAQLNWDPYASLSGWCGVTSLTIGEGGFGFAPTRPEDRELNMRMMNRIEAIPLESMRLGMRPARERTAVTEAELQRMQQLFYEGMQAGAFGFSLDKNMEDRTEDGSPLPSIVASDEEFLALAEVLGAFGVGHMGLTLGFGLTPAQRQAARQTVAQMLRISGRPFHLLDVQQGEAPEWEQRCRAEGLPLVFQRPAPVTGTEFKLSEYNMFDYMPHWVQPLVGSPEERAAKLRDPAV